MMCATGILFHSERIQCNLTYPVTTKQLKFIFMAVKIARGF